MTLARSQYETERQARARAERDPATRQRITYAGELLAPFAMGSPALARELVRRGKLRHAHAFQVGLTRGEALAAGIAP